MLQPDLDRGLPHHPRIETPIALSRDIAPLRGEVGLLCYLDEQQRRRRLESSAPVIDRIVGRSWNSVFRRWVVQP
jgi:hypothetical protein